MLSNWPIVLLAASVMCLGAILAFTNKDRPHGLAHNFGLIIMTAGTFMTGGIIVFAFLIIAVRGH